MKTKRKLQDTGVVFQQITSALIIFSILIISCLLIILVFIYLLSMEGHIKIAITVAENMADIIKIIGLAGGIFVTPTLIRITIIFLRD